MQDIQAILNISGPRQTTTLWPDPQQTTLKANETLYFTPLSTTHCNFLPLGGAPPWVLNNYSTHGVLNRPALYILSILIVVCWVIFKTSTTPGERRPLVKNSGRIMQYSHNYHWCFIFLLISIYVSVDLRRDWQRHGGAHMWSRLTLLLKRMKTRVNAHAWSQGFKI